MHKTTIKDAILGVFFPARCAICDKAIEYNRLICEECKNKVHTISGDTCMKCGKKLTGNNALYCYDCSRLHHEYDRGFAVFEYADIKKSLYRFKYSKRAEYAKYYAYVTADNLGATLKSLGVEAFIPVPIHKSRYNKRGYNQAQEYAKELSKLTGIDTMPKIIVRTKKTVPLKELSKNERQKNLKGAFKLLKNDVKLSSVCLIDDIYTTGATIDTIAGLLKDYGVKKVYYITVAIGEGL